MIQASKVYDVIVIGSGPAGLTAGIYIGRSKYKVCILGGNVPLGQLMNTTEVENYPGFPEGIGGFEYMQQVTSQAERFGAELVYEVVENVNFDEKPYIIETDFSSFSLANPNSQ